MNIVKDLKEKLGCFELNEEYINFAKEKISKSHLKKENLENSDLIDTLFK